MLSKSLHSSVLRGNGPGDSTGCLASGSAPVVTDAAAPTTASSDRCGGPLNTSFSVMTSGGAVLTRGRWSAAMTLIVVNAFRYTAPVDAFAPTDVPLGRDDFTWGILALGYDIRPHLGVSARRVQLHSRRSTRAIATRASRSSISPAPTPTTTRSSS